jgi:hypothetical protein
MANLIARILKFGLCFLPALVAAQPPHAQQTTLEGTMEILRNRYFIARAQYELESSAANATTLRSRLEQLVGALCMPAVHAAGPHAPELNSEECNTVSAELLELQPGNAVALCARDGYGAASCISAYEAQLIDSRYQPRGTKRMNRILADFEVQLTNLSEAFKATPSSETLSALHAHFAPHLQEYCQAIAIEYETNAGSASESGARRRARQSKNANATSASISTERDDEKLRDLMTSYITEKLPEQQQQQQPQDEQELNLAPSQYSDFVRVRKIPQSCNTLIEQLLAVHPDSSLAWCYRSGWYAPTCISLLQKEKRYSNSTQPGIQSEVQIDRF